MSTTGKYARGGRKTRNSDGSAEGPARPLGAGCWRAEERRANRSPGQSHALFPIRKIRKTHTIAWEVPTPNTLYKLLKHPIYAGTYVYGRRTEHVEYVDGKLVKRAGNYIEPEDCRVCIPDHHEAYITQERYDANRARLAEGRPRWTMQTNRGAIRNGQALLPGLLRCGHCGAMLSVSYKKDSALFSCSASRQSNDKRCLSFGSQLIERRISQELCRALSPLAMEAAGVALARRSEEQQQAARTARRQVEAADYEADRAFEQFDLVDPKNRLVANTLEERLNERLAQLQAARDSLEQLLVLQEPLSNDQRRTLDALARDFPALWNHPDADVTLKKRLLRAVIHEIIVTHDEERQRLAVVIHWIGGVHTRVFVEKRAAPRGSKTDPGLVETVRTLASLSDADIARILNMKKTTTPRGLRWTLDRVKNFRNQHGIPHQTALDDAAFLTGQQAAAILGISRHGLEGLFRIGLLHNHQTIDFAPWRIPKAEVHSPRVREAVRVMKANRILPKNWGCPSEEPELFPMISKGAN